MSRYSNPSSGLFGICAETLRRYSCPFTIPGQDAPRPLPSPARVLSFFPAGWKCQPEGEDIDSGCCGGGVIQLRFRERALLRQGQLFEPLTSSGPAAMVLAISRNLSCITRRSPCPGRYPLPLASAFPSTSRSHSCIPRRSPCPSRYPLPPGVRLSIHLTKSQYSSDKPQAKKLQAMSQTA